MTQKITIAPGSLEESMMAPLYAQAYCSQKYGDLFPDKAAEQVVANANYDFSHIRFKELGVLPDALCTRIISDQIRRFLEHRPNATVVDLNAGTDTFFPNVDNGMCRWVNIDHAETIDARNRLMPQRPRQTDIRSSIFDPVWFDQLDADPRSGLLFVADDVFSLYFPSAVKLLCVSLAEEFPGCTICFDTMSVGNMKRANKAARKHGYSEVKFAVDDVKALRAWSDRFTEAADVSKVPGDIMGSKALSLPTRMMLFSGGSAGITKVVRLESRFAN